MSPSNADNGTRLQPKAAPRVASIKDVAYQAGVSIATVSRVVNHRGKYSKQTEDRVLGVIKDLDFRPSNAGSTLRSGTSRTVALLMSDPLTNAYGGAVASSIAAHLHQSRKSLIIANTKNDAKTQDDILMGLRSQAVSGFVFLGTTDSPQLRRLIEAGTPCISLIRRPPSKVRSRFIGIDDYSAGQDIAIYMANLGCRKMVVVHGPLTSPATMARFQGFSEHFDQKNQSGIEVRAVEIAESTKEKSYEAAIKWLASTAGYDGIFCTTDEIAFGVIRRMRELGLSPETDLCLFGCDGNPLIKYLAAGMNTIAIRFDMLGQKVAEVLSDIKRGDSLGNEDIILPYDFSLWSPLPGEATNA